MTKEEEQKLRHCFSASYCREAELPWTNHSLRTLGFSPLTTGTPELSHLLVIPEGGYILRPQVSQEWGTWKHLRSESYTENIRWHQRLCCPPSKAWFQPMCTPTEGTAAFKHHTHHPRASECRDWFIAVLAVVPVQCVIITNTGNSLTQKLTSLHSGGKGRSFSTQQSLCKM